MKKKLVTVFFVMSMMFSFFIGFLCNRFFFQSIEFTTLELSHIDNDKLVEPVDKNSQIELGLEDVDGLYIKGNNKGRPYILLFPNQADIKACYVNND